MKLVHSLGVVAVVAVGASACREVPVVAPVPEVHALVPVGAVQAEILQEPLEADGSLTFVVRLVTADVAPSAYQGAVRFTPGAFELVSIATPQRGGEAHVLNPAGFEDGLIRFAALTPTTFSAAFVDGGVEALRFTVRPRRPVAEANLVATLDVVSEETGVALAPDRILPSLFVKRAAANRNK